MYETVWDTTLAPANFRRKILASGIVEPIDGDTKVVGPSGGRPTHLYRATGDRRPINPPFRRE